MTCRRGRETTWLTTTPAPWLPSSWARSPIHEGNGDECRIDLELARELDECSDRLVGPNCYDRLRLAFHDFEQCRLDGGGVALEGAFGDQRQVSLFHRLLHAGEAGKTERVVLVQDSDPGNAKIIGQVLDPGFGLLKIRGANIDHVAVERIPEKFRAQ